MKVGPLDVTFHRTVRVKEGREPAALPPSLGHFEVYRVADYKDKCPESWDPEGVFIPIQNTEAMWMSFRCGLPLAVMIGAGGINAVNGEKLGTTLEKGGYCVCPRQPWLDGFKNEDGSVYQFVSTEYKQGEGLTVGEQLLGKESKSGGIGIAVFEAKDPRSLEALTPPDEIIQEGYYGGVKLGMTTKGLPHLEFMTMDACLASPESAMEVSSYSRKSMAEMGLGKGGAISQKIYEDPYGLEVWKEAPTAALAVYLIGGEQFAEITGKQLPKVVDQSEYHGHWYDLKDDQITDVEGSGKFAGLKSVFTGDTSNVEVLEIIPEATIENAEGTETTTEVTPV